MPAGSGVWVCFAFEIEVVAQRCAAWSFVARGWRAGDWALSWDVSPGCVHPGLSACACRASTFRVVVRAGGAAGASAKAREGDLLGFSREIFLILPADPVARGASHMRTGEWLLDLAVRSAR